ncbi:MAG: DUF1566 domain-containing protein [Paracoccaceae bacterium]
MTLVAFQNSRIVDIVPVMMKSFTLSLLALAAASSVWAACPIGEVTGHLVRSKGVILDTNTGLEWQTCLHGQAQTGTGCVGTATEVPWLEADRLADEMGWRLPKLEDLETVLDGEDGGGFFPMPFGLCQTGQIWTASPGFPVNDVAAVLELDTGRVWGTGKGVARFFVLVRGEIDIEYFSGSQPKL